MKGWHSYFFKVDIVGAIDSRSERRLKIQMGGLTGSECPQPCNYTGRKWRDILAGTRTGTSTVLALLCCHKSCITNYKSKLALTLV